MNLAQKFQDALTDEPNRPFLVELSAAGDAVRAATREQVVAEAAAWQRRFAEAGLATGDAVALCPPRSSTLPAVHLAALAAGLAVVPVNPALTPAERTSLLAAAGVTRVFGGADETSPPAPGGRFEIVERGNDDVALILYTSGTTGRPKSVPLSHGNLLYDLEALAAAWRRGSRDRVLHLLPAHHFHGLVLATYGSLLSGCEIYLAPRFEPRAAIDSIRRHAISLVMGVPTMYARMADAYDAGDDLSSLRLALCGSAPLDPTTWKRFHDRFGVALVERYGLTETGIVATNPLESPRPGSVGRPLHGTRIEILTDEIFEVFGGARPTARGEICVSGPSVTAGYGNAPEANRESFLDGRFRTGDLGYFDAEGYLVIDGRLKELIIVGGTNVIPGEVERALANVEGVRELAAAGAADADLGEVVAVFVALTPGANAKDVEERLQVAAEAELARYKRPRRYRFVDELPRNAMGKIDRAALSGAV